MGSLTNQTLSQSPTLNKIGRGYFAEDTPDDGVANGRGEFTAKDGRSTRNYVMASNITSQQFLSQFLVQILGQTTTTTSNLKLQRTLPVCDPCWPWLYASHISSVRGVGQSVEALALPKLEVPPIGDWSFYQGYKFSVTYEPRPYTLLTDANVSVIGMPAFWQDNGTNTGAWKAAAEWNRYCYWTTAPQFNQITARAGQMKFRTNAGAPNGLPFFDMPRIQLPDYIVKWNWVQVPYRYVTAANSFLTKYQGRVNQFDFPSDGPLWEAGQLLYVGFHASDPYIPTVPVMTTINGATKPPMIFSTEKLCDIEFTFLGTQRTASDAPVATQGNWIYAGHNLMPWWKDRLFHLVTVQPSPDVAAGWQPFWMSFPFEKLFQDPAL